MKLVAVMHDDQMSRAHEVFEDEDGNAHVREHGTRKIKQTTYADAWSYLDACRENFGWRIEYS